MLLKEYTPLVLTPQQLNEVMDTSAGASPVIKRVLLQKANAKNRNGRIYPKDVLEREINKYNDTFVKTRRALGELDHRDSMTVMLQNVSHIITEIWWEGDDVYGNIEILNDPEFPAGRIAYGLLKRKIPVGISSRSMGSLTETGDGAIVNDDLAMSCFDLVSYESTIGSNLNLNEGVIKTTSKFDEIDRLIYDIICNNSGQCSCKK